MIKNICLVVSAFVMSFLVGYSVLSWTGPTGTAPTSNVAAPINVGATAQTKAGNLTVPILYDSDNNAYYINPASTGTSALFAGSVGIGTISPGQKLTVVGTIESTSGGIKFPDGTTQTTAAAWAVPSDVKITNATHNGNFGGYAAMKTWIQTNDCSGYHVCDETEITRWLQNGGGVLTSADCWYNGGVTDIHYSDSYHYSNDCMGWTSSTLLGLAWPPWDHIGAWDLTQLSCATLHAVCCCT